MKIITTVALVLAFLSWCEAGNEVIQYAKVRDVQSLSGVVADSSGAPIAGAIVCEMSGGWKTQLGCTETDPQGRWSLKPIGKAKTYEIRFAKGGFHQVWMRLRLRPSAKPFTIEMPVAT